MSGNNLRAIALDPPQGLDALAAIGGVGAGKLERYWREVIAALVAIDPVTGSTMRPA